MTPCKVELRNIYKSFGGIAALRDVTVSAIPGEIHALAGENGAGKSTLMKILAGSYPLDQGKILIDGNKVILHDPQDGKKAGIGIIYQEFALVPDLSVAENIFLPYLNQGRVWMKWADIRHRSEEIIRSLGFDIPVTKKVWELSTSGQQVVEIAKALCENVQVLILDEPTAVLAPNETEKLFEVLGRLKEQGVTLFYVTHRLEEIFRIADTLTVLKDGRVSRTGPVKKLNRDQVVMAMIGREMKSLFPESSTHTGKVLLEINHLRSGNRIRDVSFNLREGEVLGISGLMGSGRTETLRAIFSADKRDQGEILLDGKAVHFRSPADAVRQGIGLVPEDRKTQGILLSLSVSQNLTLTQLNQISSPLGMISRSREHQQARDLMTRLGIRGRGIDINVNTLSGGNQQKVVLAKWLGRRCRILLLDEPTRGIDIGAKEEIYRLIHHLAGQGMGIIFVSSEMIELMGMSDRILVMKKGSISGELHRPAFSEEAIMRLSID